MDLKMYKLQGRASPPAPLTYLWLPTETCGNSLS